MPRCLACHKINKLSQAQLCSTAYSKMVHSYDYVFSLIFSRLQGSLSLECSDGVAWVHSSFQLVPTTTTTTAHNIRPTTPGRPKPGPSKADLRSKDERTKDDNQNLKKERRQTLYFDQFGRRLVNRVLTTNINQKVIDDNNNAELISKQAMQAPPANHNWRPETELESPQVFKGGNVLKIQYNLG